VVGAAVPSTAVSAKTVVPGGAIAGSWSCSSNSAWSSPSSCASAASISAWATIGNSVRLPPSVGCALRTFVMTGSSPAGTSVIAFSGTLPPGPSPTASTSTDAVLGLTLVGGTMSARGSVMARTVRNRMPPSVAMTLPDGIVFGPRVS
jgi:hypothetical protein